MLQLIKNWLELKNNLNHRIVFFAYTVVVFILTLMPIDPSTDQGFLSIFKFPHRDKLVHLLMFLGMTLLYQIAFRNKPKFQVFLLPFLTGVLIEILQFALDLGRSFDLLDILANGLGVWIGLLLFPKLNQHLT